MNLVFIFCCIYFEGKRHWNDTTTGAHHIWCESTQAEIFNCTKYSQRRAEIITAVVAIRIPILVYGQYSVEFHPYLSPCIEHAGWENSRDQGLIDWLNLSFLKRFVGFFIKAYWNGVFDALNRGAWSVNSISFLFTSTFEVIACAISS